MGVHLLDMTTEEHEAALIRTSALMDLDADISPEQLKELDELVDRVVEYEEEHFKL